MMPYWSRAAGVACAAIIALTSWSCSDKDPAGPGNIEFPTLSSQVQSTFCIRGTATKGQTKTGTIASTDCDDGGGYSESYVVKVAATGNVILTVDSGFDSFLTLLRIDSYTATAANVSLVALDDDSAGDLDAQLSLTLNAGTNYMILVSGLDYTETGSYTLTIQ